jgi:outer membrane protein OmpA-like peptidoglycan-associated protein
MSADLLDSLGACVTPELVGRIGATLAESPASVSKGMSGVLPALLGGLVQKSTDRGAFQEIFSVVTDPANDGSALRDPGSLLGTLTQGGDSFATLAATLLPLLFGGRTDRLAGAIADYAGIKSSSATALLRLGAPLVLGLLGDRVRREGLGAPGLAALLGGQRDSISRAIPAALSGVLGGLAAPRAAEPRPEPRSTAPARPSGLRWLVPLAIAAGLIALFWNLVRGDDSDRRTAERTPPAALTTPPVAAPPPSLGMRRHALPNGAQISIPEAGFESEILRFLTDAGRPLDSWFDFDRVLFQTDSAELMASSREQLANLAQILKAYPSVRVKIGGYTDNTGDAAHNLALSRARADSVRGELLALGVAADRIEAEGYGQEHPVASNDTEAGRAQNRRIAMRVTAR